MTKVEAIKEFTALNGVYETYSAQMVDNNERLLVMANIDEEQELLDGLWNRLYAENKIVASGSRYAVFELDEGFKVEIDFEE